MENNDSDINNNRGQIKFKDCWETYRLSDDGKEWINAEGETSNSDSSQFKEYTIGYRGSYSFWFDKSSDVYKKIFNKPGIYLIVSDGLQLAKVVNIQ